MIGQIFDRISELKPDMVQTQGNVEDSPPFFGWIFQHGGKLWIAEPDWLSAQQWKMCETAARYTCEPEICNQIGMSGHIPVKQLADSNASRYQDAGKECMPNAC